MNIHKNNEILHDPNYEVVRYEKKYYSSYFRLFGLVYQKKLKASNSRILQTAYGKNITFLMKYRNQIVGAHSLYSMIFKIRNRDFMCGMSTMTMTHPDHRKKGIFVALAKKTHEEAKKKKFGFVYGYSKSASLYGYKKRLKRKELPWANFIKIKNVDFKVKEIPKVHEHWFPKNLDFLNKEYKTKNDFPVRVEREYRFFKWRYKENPYFRYLTCYKKDEFFFVFKKYFDSIHIIDFIGRGSQVYHTLIATAFETAKKLSCKDVTMWIPNKHPIMKLLGRKCVKKLEPKDLYLNVLVFEKKLEPIVYDFNNWYYTMGDADVF